MVTQELRDSVKKENEKTCKLIEQEYGKAWEKRFDAAVEAEYEIEMQIDSLVKKQPYIASKDIINPFPGAPFPMYPIDSNVIIGSSVNNLTGELSCYSEYF